MKKLNYLLSAVVILGVMATIGCSKDDGPSQTAEEKLFDKITGTWTASAVTYNTSDDRTTVYSGFTITLSGSSDAGYSYSASVPAGVDFGPFKSQTSGGWTFTNEVTDANASSVGITRTADALPITLFIDSETQVRLEFTYTDDDRDGNHDGREEAVSGSWVFTLGK